MEVDLTLRVDLTSIGHGDETTAQFEANNMIVLDQIEPVEGSNILNTQFDKEKNRAYRVNRAWLTPKQIVAMYEWARRAEVEGSSGA